MSDYSPDLADRMRAVLEQNDQGMFTVPARGIYTHQWLWDSCFTAIGLRHVNIERAQNEILSLLRGQWANGMLPHMVLAKKRHGDNIWRSMVNPNSPEGVETSGITQPPMVAEAVLRIGEKLKVPERRSWYQSVFPALLNYHEWLYYDRDPHEEGLIVQLHPWETGLDNTPPWISELRDHMMPVWIRVVDTLHLSFLVNIFRYDRKYHIPAEERLDTIEALELYHIQRRLRRKMYSTERALAHSMLAIEDLAFNSIMIRANSCLKKIAETIGRELPAELLARMQKTEEALEKLWDPYSGQYFSRNFVTHKLIKEPTVATLLPLYAGSVTEYRAKQLVDLIKDKKLFGTEFPLPTVPINSTWFKPHGYWQGPTWVNINWLIIDGLKRYGFKEEAGELTAKTLKMVDQNGASEYFSPLDGSPAGAENFSWTAALALDLINEK